MKRLLMLTFLAVHILWAGSGAAQEATISGIRPESFSGVKLAGNSDRFYLAFMDAATQDSASVRLRVFDRGMQPTLDIGIPMPKGTELAASAHTGQFYLLQLVNAGNKTRTTIAVDDAGNIFKRKDENDIRISLLAPANFPTFYPVGMNEFIMLRTSREGKPVVEIEMWDLELQSRWQKDFGERGTELIGLKSEADRVYLLKKQRDDARQVYSIQSVSGMVGDIFYTTELKEADKIAIPSYLDVRHGFATIAGVFQNEASGKTGGVFYGWVNHEGRPERMNFIPWAAVKAQVKSPLITELENGKAGLLIQNIIRDEKDEGVTLVGELYKKITGAQANTATFVVQDFVLMHINSEGQVDRITQIAKPEKELLIQGNMSAKTDVELAEWLHKNNFFSYRALLPVAGKNVLTYLNNGGKGSVAFATIDSTGTVPKENIVTVSLDRQAVAELGKNRDRNKENATVSKAVLNSAEKDLREFALTGMAKDIIPTQEGQVLIYNYSDPDLTLWIMPVEMR